LRVLVRIKSAVPKAKTTAAKIWERIVSGYSVVARKKVIQGLLQRAVCGDLIGELKKYWRHAPGVIYHSW
jgi:hypothetical protein